jgi:hypothetical protein
VSLNAAALIAIVACGPAAPEPAAKPAPRVEPAVVTDGPPQSASFSLRFADTRTPTSAGIKKTLVGSRVFQELVIGLNRDIETPAPIAVEVIECGEPNAYYDPARRAVSVCYDMIALISRSFDDIKSDDEHMVATLGAAVFIFSHELGHALIDTLELSFTGREEDAVDQLATLLLVEAGPEGAQAARDGAALFARLAAGRGDQMPLWAEHSLEEQRFFNVLCWIYGSDSKAHADLVSDGALPPERAERCAEEWTRLRGAWTRLLAPHQRSSL